MLYIMIPPLPLVGKWAIFNIADSFICIGVGLFIVAELFFPSEEEEKKTDAKESSAAPAESKTSAPTPKT